jgi:hypothetical protein
MPKMTRTGLAMAAALLLAAPLSAQGPLGPTHLPRVALDRADAVPVLVDRIYTVRVASFEDPDGRISERVASRLREAGVPVWVTRRQRRGHGVSRLQVGAVTSQADARVLQRVLRGELAWPTYVARLDAHQVTVRAVRATRRLLGGE